MVRVWTKAARFVVYPRVLELTRSLRLEQYHFSSTMQDDVIGQFLARRRSLSWKSNRRCIFKP